MHDVIIICRDIGVVRIFAKGGGAPKNQKFAKVPLQKKSTFIKMSCRHRFFCTRTFAPIGARVEKNLHQWCKIWYFNAFSCHLVRNFLHQLVQDLKIFCTNAKIFAPIPLDWCKKKRCYSHSHIVTTLNPKSLRYVSFSPIHV